ncbi:DUF4134 domain-containing protein [Negadavirga shengliensis]|uniref:DUF4134 domain-containing protein n=1 Tax=Negadavirga shengliensis TaxID=1389218 RepID=A0ABV9T0N4_9BACT
MHFLFLLTLITVLVSLEAFSQSGTAGIVDATNHIITYYQTAINLMYAIGALVGLIGAIKVYNKWNSGDHDTGKVATAWFGSCIFLVLVATVLSSFFGL